MTVVISLGLRWQRAQQIDPASIEPLGLGWFVVPSSRDPTGYAVHIDFDVDGKLIAAALLALHGPMLCELDGALSAGELSLDGAVQHRQWRPSHRSCDTRSYFARE
jgi:hypothetical protein